MEYLKMRFNSIISIFIKSPQPFEERQCTKGEVYFDQIYRILSWDDASSTLIVFLISNFLFWFIVYFQFRLFGLLFLTFLCLFLWDSYYETKDLSTYHLKYVSHLDTYFSDVLNNLLVLRKESPSSFCIAMSITFLFLSFIARNISGYTIAYLTILAVFFVPLGYKVLPQEYQNAINNFLNSLRTTKSLLPEEELMPLVSNFDLDSLLSDRTADSATNSLASSISAMPSYLEVNNDELEEDDLLPIRTREGTPGGLSSTDSDSDNKDIHFDAVHFNGDSSEEEERNLMTGLRFSGVDVPDDRGLSNVLTNFASLGGNLMANVIKNAMTTAAAANERKNSSSDSEFEIINSEDVKE